MAGGTLSGSLRTPEILGMASPDSPCLAPSAPRKVQECCCRQRWTFQQGLQAGSEPNLESRQLGGRASELQSLCRLMVEGIVMMVVMAME